MADDEIPVRVPGIDGKPPLPPARVDIGLVEDDEREAKALLELVAPLEHDARGAGDDDALDALSQQELLEDEPGLDGLSQAHVVGDEEVDPREREGLPERLELVALGDDAGAQRGLEQRGIGRGDAPPAEGVQVGREGARIVGRGVRAEGALARGDDAGVDLGVPDDVEPLALGVDGARLCRF